MGMANFAGDIPDFLLKSEIYYVTVATFSGECLITNRRIQRWFNTFISADQVPHLRSIIHQEQWPLYEQAVARCIADSTATITFALKPPNKDDSSNSHINWEFSALTDADSTPVAILGIGHDYPDAGCDHQQLALAHQSVDDILEEISDGYYQLDNQWRFTKVNRVTEAILGKSRHILAGQSIWSFMPDSPHYQYPERLRKAKATGVPEEFQDYSPELDKWFTCSVYPVPTGVNVFFCDITEQKRTEIALKESRNKLKAMLDSMLDSYILVDTDSKILLFNKVASEFTKKYFCKELNEEVYIADVLPEENRRIFEACFPLALKGERSIVELQRVIDGQMRWFEIAYLPVHDDNGQLIGISKNTRDITGIKEAQIKVREQDVLLSAIYQSTTEACTFIDLDFTIRYCNHVVQHITKAVFGREARPGDRSLDFVLPEYQDEFEAFYKRVVTGEKVTVERTDGKNWWQFAMYPVYDTQHQIIGIAHNVQDVTERKQREMKILEQNLALRAIARHHSHELRKPVANILSICDLLTNFPQGDKDLMATSLRNMQSEVKKLDEMIQSIVIQAAEAEDVSALIGRS